MGKTIEYKEKFHRYSNRVPDRQIKELLENPKVEFFLDESTDYSNNTTEYVVRIKIDNSED